MTNMPSFVFIHPTGNQNVRADLRALENAGLLSAFYTTVAWRAEGRLSTYIPKALRDELERRSYEVDARSIRCQPLLELIRLASLRLHWTRLVAQERGWASVDRVGLRLARKLARDLRRERVRADAIYAYEDVANEPFKAARTLGMARVLELPIGYWRAGYEILAEERERRPAWSSTLEALRDSTEKQERKDEEIRAADHIIVPCEFARRSLEKHPSFSATVDVIPYGAPRPTTEIDSSKYSHPRSASRALRVLYVGQLSQRKGISYLFDAMRRIRCEATLTIIGSKPLAKCDALEAELSGHQWLGTMSHQRVLAAMREHDVLVFPSLFEGFGLVILEAMAQGLPVITTPNTGGPMVIDDGGDGFIVPIRDAPAVADRIEQLACGRDLLMEMRAAALAKAHKFSWAQREGRLIATLAARIPGASL